jgi:hypothetical protein
MISIPVKIAEYNGWKGGSWVKMIPVTTDGQKSLFIQPLENVN